MRIRYKSLISMHVIKVSVVYVTHSCGFTTAAWRKLWNSVFKTRLKQSTVMFLFSICSQTFSEIFRDYSFISEMCCDRIWVLGLYTSKLISQAFCFRKQCRAGPTSFLWMSVYHVIFFGYFVKIFCKRYYELCEEYSRYFISILTKCF